MSYPIPERPATILATLHESTRSVIERVYLAFAMDDWISELVIAKENRIARLEADKKALLEALDAMLDMYSVEDCDCNYAGTCAFCVARAAIAQARKP